MTVFKGLINRPLFLFLCLTALFCMSPITVTLTRLEKGEIVPARWQNAGSITGVQPPVDCASRNLNGQFSLQCARGDWTSPAGWHVQQADWTDLNHDNLPEVTMLVKRPFSPWPVDRVLPYGGYIQSHQDMEGFSSHIIMIGWKDDHWGELWAGSALARPVRSFIACDVDNDGRQELAVLEGSYADSKPVSAESFAIWKWNSFGFDLISREEKPLTWLVAVTTRDNITLLLTQ